MILNKYQITVILLSIFIFLFPFGCKNRVINDKKSYFEATYKAIKDALNYDIECSLQYLNTIDDKINIENIKEEFSKTLYNSQTDLYSILKNIERNGVSKDFNDYLSSNILFFQLVGKFTVNNSKKLIEMVYGDNNNEILFQLLNLNNHLYEYIEERANQYLLKMP